MPDDNSSREARRAQVPHAWVPLGELWTLLERHEGIPRAEAEPLLIPIIEAGHSIDHEVVREGLPRVAMHPPSGQRPLVVAGGPWAGGDGRCRLTREGWHEVDWDAGTIAGARILVRWSSAVATVRSERKDRARREASAQITAGSAAAAALTEQATPPPAKTPGGRPVKHDWDAFWIEVALYAAKEDLQHQYRADLARHMKEWFGRQSPDPPDETTIEKKLKRLWDRVTRET
jgi:hypothetical protein